MRITTTCVVTGDRLFDDLPHISTLLCPSKRQRDVKKSCMASGENDIVSLCFHRLHINTAHWDSMGELQWYVSLKDFFPF